MTDISLEEQATNAQTLEHIQHVRNLINLAVGELLHRGVIHDRSKLGDVERCMYTEFTPKLKTTAYGSDEYKALLKAMGPALQHHYEHNRHHPEHFGEDGVEGMNLIDLLEMLLDWKASTLRNPNGDINRSIDVGVERFKLGPQLAAILRNTVRDLKLDEYGKTV